MGIAERRAILNAIEEMQSNGVASRSWVMAGLLLGLCQRCPEWTGGGCAPRAPEPAEFAAMLCDAGAWCDKWTAAHRDRGGPTR